MAVPRGEAFFAEPAKLVIPKQKEWRMVDDGIYLLPGINKYTGFAGLVCKVQTSKTSGNPYAMALIPQHLESGDKFVFEFQSGLIRKLSPGMAISREQAIEFGVRFGICCRCGAELTNEESIELGIGPICREKMGW